MRPTITLTTPVDADPQYPGETFDKYGVEKYWVVPETGLIHIRASNVFVSSGQFFHDDNSTLQVTVGSGPDYSAILDSVGSDAMETAILQWFLDSGYVDGTLT